MAAEEAKTTVAVAEPLPPLPKFGAIVGSAGTGKTTLIKRYLAARRDVVVSATTGVAAINTGGTTIHSRLGYYDLFSLQMAHKAGKIVRALISYYYKGVRVWIVDEVSMLGGDQLTILAQAIDQANEKLSADGHLLTMVNEPLQHSEGLPTDVHTHTVREEERSVRRNAGTLGASPISLILVGDPCLAVGTPVMLADGRIVPVEAIEAGMQVMGPDSKPRNVVRRTNGVASLFRVEQTNGAAYTVSVGHQLALQRGVDGQRQEWRGLRYPEYGDALTMPVEEFAGKSKKFKVVFVGYRAGLIRFKAHPVSLDPYFLGVWLGDGDSDGARITNMDKEVIDYCRTYATQLGLGSALHGWARTRAVRVRMTNGRKLGHTPNPLLVNLRAYNLERNKHIPNDYLYNSEEVRLRLLAGLLDTDGNWSGNRYRISLTNERLIQQVKQLADQLGFRTGFRATKIYDRDAPCWTVTIGGDTWRIPCLVKRKKSKPRNLRRNRLTSALTVTPAGIGEYVGFEVDDDHLFLLGDGTVTRNCQLPPVKAPWFFESPEWKGKFEGNVHRLTVVHRQTDADFIAALREARSGHGPGALGYFRSMIHPFRDEDFGGLMILATNAEVDAENARKLALCEGKEIRFKNHKEGEPHRTKDWKAIPEELVLKEGAKVMILANYRTREEGLVYVNGDMGTLVGLTRTGASDPEWEEDIPDQLPVVRLERTGRTVMVEPASRDIKVPWDRATDSEKHEYLTHLEERKTSAKKNLERQRKNLDLAVEDFDRLMIERDIAVSEKLIAEMESGAEPDYLTVAWMTYTPLRLAYASTTHKCQGLTLDRIQIDLSSGFWTMCPGSLYVALSRARTPEGIRIVGSNEKFLARCRADWKVRSFV